MRGFCKTHRFIMLLLCLALFSVSAHAMTRVTKEQVLGKYYSIQAEPELMSPKILMIGNSHTYINDVPEMLRSLCESAGIHAKVAGLSVGGHSLKQYVFPETQREQVYADKLISLLEEEDWDYVILQGKRAEEVLDAEVFTDAIRTIQSCLSSDAQVVIYMPWTAEDPEHYSDPNNSATIGQMITSLYPIAESLDCALAPSGIAFERAKVLYPDINLYGLDHSHANPIGSYLSACTIFGTMLGIDPQGLPYYGGISLTNGRKMQEIAAGLTVNRETIIPQKKGKAARILFPGLVPARLVSGRRVHLCHRLTRNGSYLPGTGSMAYGHVPVPWKN